MKTSPGQFRSTASLARKCLFWLIFPLVVIPAIAGSNQIKPLNTVELTLPVLTVSQGPGGKWSGKVVDLELTATQKSDNRPLLVAIAEDRPSGVGEQFRAAMWSAASTVALERGDPLPVKIPLKMLSMIPLKIPAKIPVMIPLMMLLKT